MVFTGTPSGVTNEKPATLRRPVVFLTIHPLASGEPSAKRNAGHEEVRGTGDRTRHHSSQKTGSMGQSDPREKQKASWKESHHLALGFATETTTAGAPSVDGTNSSSPRRNGRDAPGRERNSPLRRKPIVPKMEAETNRRSLWDIARGFSHPGIREKYEVGYRGREEPRELFQPTHVCVSGNASFCKPAGYRTGPTETHCPLEQILPHKGIL